MSIHDPDPSSALTELAAWGWSPEFHAAFEALDAPGLSPARVTRQHRDRYVVVTAAGGRSASVSGRFRHEARTEADFPAVGDWVAVHGGPGAGSDKAAAVIHRLLPRRSAFSRAAAGPTTTEQVIAANVDVVFVVTSLNRDFNIRRMERYVALAWESGAQPVIILSKADLVDDLQGSVLAAEAAAPGVDVLAVSVVDGTGMDRVASMMAPGRTVALVGSSGAGKSTLVNALAGQELMATAEVRLDDARGRHTTSGRHLLQLESGLILDTPGLRELGLLDGDGIENSFADIAELANRCRFSDCGHGAEPDCAVTAALAAGRLERDRFDAYEKLVREARYAERKTDAFARLAERRRWRNISRSVGVHMQLKYGDDR
jgi:ribosome biogenesis GTPase